MIINMQNARILNLFKIGGLHVLRTIQRYGILEKDIYNMNETGFQMGVTSTAKVICGIKTKESHAKILQSGNREWVTAIICINAVGWMLSPQIMFAAANHWSHDLSDDYLISVNKNGWTTNELGVGWLQEVFNCVIYSFADNWQI